MPMLNWYPVDRVSPQDTHNFQTCQLCTSSLTTLSELTNPYRHKQNARLRKLNDLAKMKNNEYCRGPGLGFVVGRSESDLKKKDTIQKRLGKYNEGLGTNKGTSSKNIWHMS